MCEKQRPVMRGVGDGLVDPTSARFFFPSPQNNPEEAFLLLSLTDEVRVVFRVPPGENHYDLIQREEGREVGLRPRSSDHDGWRPGMVVIQSKEISLGDFPLVIIADEAEPRVFLECFVQGGHVRISGCRNVLVTNGLEGHPATEAMRTMVQRILAEFPALYP